MPGGTRGYLKSMGFLYQNLLNELGRSKRPKKAARPDSEEAEDDLEVGEGGEEENENSNHEDNMPGRSGERNRLEGLQSLGFGQKSDKIKVCLVRELAIYVWILSGSWQGHGVACKKTSNVQVELVRH